MIHPYSELRFVNREIGLGVFATRDIPKGTITWVFDSLDQIIPDARAEALPASLQELLEIYSYRNGRGERVLCWDHGRYVNHSCHPTSLAPGFDLEIAVRDIRAGEQITDDYGSLNPDSPFQCHCRTAQCRGTVGPGDFDRLADHWDALVGSAFSNLGNVPQPLWELVQEKARVNAAVSGALKVPSCRAHALRALNAAV